MLVGFLTGIGIQISLEQIPGVLGFSYSGHGPVIRLLENWQPFSHVNPWALTVSAGVLIIIIASKRLSKKIPGPLITVICAIAVTWAFDLE